MSRVGILKAALICIFSLPVVAGPAVHAQKAPEGFARPPIHLKSASGTSTPGGLAPSTVRTAYGFNLITNQGAGQTIGIVDAYDDPNIESDLAVFVKQYSLATCTSSNGCFRKVYAAGVAPPVDSGWSLEISLDVEWAHAMAPQAKILLVEAKSNSVTDLLAAVDVAVQNGASVVSMSFGGPELSNETTYDSPHFAVNGVTFVVSSGDSGSGVEYPASSPDVIAVGGTTLTLTKTGAYSSETAWSGSGGGLSTYELEPLWQSTLKIPNDLSAKRGVPDVSYNGNPNTGFAVYDTVKYNGASGWFTVGGTSAGAPQWAALFAIANSMRVAAGKKTLTSAGGDPLYSLATGTAYATNYHDITSGTNGTCGVLCTAATGYDYVTGAGSPRANNLINALVALP